MTGRREVVALVIAVQSMPYRWPAEPTAESARLLGAGSCASKHALLAEDLAAVGVRSRPLLCVGPLVPPSLLEVPALSDGADLVEVHELLTVDVPDCGPCRVDVTWDPPLVRAGLPGTLDWDGRSDMEVAVGAARTYHAPDPVDLRAAKEALRRRLYRDDQRARRDRVLAAMSELFDALRTSRPGGTPR